MQKIDKRTIIYILIIVIFLVGIYFSFIKKENSYIENSINTIILNTNEENNQIEEKSNKIIIYITGAVKNEGIYEIEENSRIADSIEIAGGLTTEANISNINLAYILEDGMKIYIPKKNENTNSIKDETNTYISKENSNTESSQKQINNKININTATQSELETLPGIGPSIALNIINYRKEKGKFNSIEDIKKVNGIGENKYNNIKELIKI